MVQPPPPLSHTQHFSLPCTFPKNTTTTTTTTTFPFTCHFGLGFLHSVEAVCSHRAMLVLFAIQMVTPRLDYAPLLRDRFGGNEVHLP